MDSKNLHEKSMDPNICKSNLYDVWAKDYDSYVKSLSYEGPTNLVNNVIPIIHDKNMNNLKILVLGVEQV